ncbi:hypothetical protein [Candidatus Pristimantibacillus sp. PTI5]
MTSYSSAIANRPVVQIIKEADGHQVHEPDVLDLAASRNITIVSSTG